MNKGISRRSFETINIILIAILFFLIISLFYESISSNEIEYFPPKVKTDTGDSLSTKMQEIDSSPSNIANGTYVIDEESTPSNTNIPDEEEPGKSVFDFTTYKYPEYESISGESFEIGDKIIFLGQEGTLLDGKIENGKITSQVLQISDDQEKIILIYYQKDHYIYGHLELIMYPQEEDKRKSAIMKQNGNELVNCLVYDSGLGYLTYVKALFEPDKVSPGLKARVFC